MSKGKGATRADGAVFFSRSWDRKRGSTNREWQNQLEVKLSKLTETDNIEAYLMMFERTMAAYEVPENRWPYKLAPMLTGKAQQAYAVIEPARAADYAEVRTAILRRYDISKET